MTAFLPQFTEGEWQVGFSENKYLTKPSFWGVTSKLSIQSIKSNVLHYSLVNVLISNRGELAAAPQKTKWPNSNVTSPAKPSSSPRQSKFPSFSPPHPFVHRPPPHGTPTLYFICVYFLYLLLLLVRGSDSSCIQHMLFSIHVSATELWARFYLLCHYRSPSASNCPGTDENG